MLRRIAKPLFWILLFVAIVLVVRDKGFPDFMRLPIAAVDPTSESAFEAWLAEEPGRLDEFAEFEQFLRDEAAFGIVPAWQLTRIDGFYASRCELLVFRLPPRELWPNVVPALERVRDYVVPAVGPVAVQSSYRTPELNVCAGGASRSRHLDFAALDLRLEGRTTDLPHLYRTLCAMHRDAGPGSRMGLGAYYDLEDDGFNRGGRFHIDAAGYRTWGRSYTSASSPCRRLN